MSSWRKMKRLRGGSKGGNKGIEEKRASYRWILYSPEEIANTLGSNLENGLTDEQAVKILKINGPNSLPTGKSKRKKIGGFFRQFAEITHIVLFAMGVIHLVLQITAGGCLLIILSIINFSVTYIQGLGFENLIKKLQSSATTQALVVRNGITKKIESKNLVVGDVVILQSGDTVPADLRIIESSELKCSEAAFTGESIDVKKVASRLGEECKSLQERRNMAFISTNIVSGHGKGIVVAKGEDTQLAKISKSLTVVDDKITTNTDKLLLKMYAFFLILAIAVTILILAVNRFQLTSSVTAFAMTAIMSVLPSGLRTVMLILLTASSRRLLKCNVVIKRLQILELSGYAKLLFCDKTGTLTVATMTAVLCWTPDLGYVTTTGRGIVPEGHLCRIKDLHILRECLSEIKNEENYDIVRNFDQLSLNEKYVIITSALCNNSFIEPSFSGKNAEIITWKGFGSPTELSLCVLSHKVGAQKSVLEALGWKVEKEIPFDSKTKMMSVLVKSPDNVYHLLTKGAPEILLEYMQISGSGDHASYISSLIDPLTEMSLRVLAFSSKIIQNEEANMIINDIAVKDNLLYNNTQFNGFVAIHDPLRPGIPQTISTLKNAGISVKLITGDSKGTAIEISKEAGIIDPNLSPIDLDRIVCSGNDLQELSDEALANREIPDVIYRCTPELKLRVVKNMRYPGYKSIVIGDGLNDAASIKASDVGISMGIVSTDITRAAADVVLVNDDFSQITQLLFEGRGVCWKLRYFLMYYWITLVGSLLCCLVAINNKAINTGVWMLIITGSTIMLSYLVSTLGCAWFFDTHPPAGLMKMPPKSEKDPTFTPEIISDIIVHSLLFTICSLSPFFIVLYSDDNQDFIDYNSNLHMDKSDSLYRGRTASFLTFTFLLLIHAIHCRSMRMSEWNMEGMKRTLKNRFVLLTSLLLLVFCCCMAYIKEAAEVVLYQAVITWETSLVPIFIFIDILGIEGYKFIKRHAYGCHTDEANIK